MSSTFTVRTATPDDIGFIIPLVVESSGGVWSAIWNAIKIQSETLDQFAYQYLKDTTNKLSIENTYIGELEGQCLGILIIYNEKKDKDSSNKSAEKYAMPSELVEALSPYSDLSDLDSLFISELCTVPESRGKGIGTLMLEHARFLAKERNYRAITLRVYSQNTQAIKLYTRFGFKPVDQRKVLPYPGIKAKGEVVLMSYSIE